MGLASGRLCAGPRERVRAGLFTAITVLFAVLPDFDVLPLALGVPDRGLFGHRGLLHTPVFAAAVGVVVALLCRRRWGIDLGRSARAGLAAALLVASHGLLDAMSQDGRGILFLWPLSERRFHMPWRPIPDAPTGLHFFSRVGFRHLAIELAYFCPLVVYAFGRTLGRLFARPDPRRAPARRIMA